MTATSVVERDAPSHAPPAIFVAGHADAAGWDRFVNAHPQSTGYHAWAWRDVFKNALGHDSIYLAARDGQAIVGALPLVHIKSALFGQTLTSLAFLNYGGVVADSPVVAQGLLAAAKDVARKAGCHHVELRHRSQRFPDLPYRQHKVTMLLALGPGMWDRLDRKVRNQIRKAQKSNLTVDRGGLDRLDEFYSVFARNMRDLGTPVYSRKFFEEVLRRFSDRARLHVVRLGSQPIAAALTYRTGSTVEVPWASSIRDHNALCPNHLLYWSVIETAIDEGCEVLDFGRSTPNEGTFKFKEQWGAQPMPLYWEYLLSAGGELPNLGPANPKYRMMIKVWKRLPLRVATTVGPYVVRGIP